MAWMNTWWFQLIKAILGMASTGVLAAAASGDASIPVWIAPVLMGVSGALQVGQKK